MRTSSYFVVFQILTMKQVYKSTDLNANFVSLRFVFYRRRKLESFRMCSELIIIIINKLKEAINFQLVIKY